MKKDNTDTLVGRVLELSRVIGDFKDNPNRTRHLMPVIYVRHIGRYIIRIEILKRKLKTRDIIRIEVLKRKLKR